LKRIIRKIGASFFCFILFSVVFTSVLTASDINVSLDIKTTRLKITINNEDKLIDAGRIVGTISNYGENISDIRIEIEIESDGSMPVEAEGGGAHIEIYPTKAIYHVSFLETGDTLDWGISIGVSDDSITDVRYGVDVYIPKENETGLKRIYASTDLSLPVEVIVEDKPANYDGQTYDPQPEGEVRDFIERNLTYIVLVVAIIAIIALLVAILKK
jgi:hypothetical protein